MNGPWTSWEEAIDAQATGNRKVAHTVTFYSNGPSERQCGVIVTTDGAGGKRRMLALKSEDGSWSEYTGPSKILFPKAYGLHDRIKYVVGFEKLAAYLRNVGFPAIYLGNIESECDAERVIAAYPSYTLVLLPSDDYDYEETADRLSRVAIDSQEKTTIAIAQQESDAEDARWEFKVMHYYDGSTVDGYCSAFPYIRLMQPILERPIREHLTGTHANQRLDSEHGDPWVWSSGTEPRVKDIDNWYLLNRYVNSNRVLYDECTDSFYRYSEKEGVWKRESFARMRHDLTLAFRQFVIDRGQDKLACKATEPRMAQLTRQL